MGRSGCGAGARDPKLEDGLYREIYEFASSAGALEGYVYPRGELDPNGLGDWVHNLVKQYEALPAQVRESFQGSLDRTLGRAVHSLVGQLGEDHEYVRSLRSLVKGEVPGSERDFEKEKREKARKYAG